MITVYDFDVSKVMSKIAAVWFPLLLIVAGLSADASFAQTEQEAEPFVEPVKSRSEYAKEIELLDREVTTIRTRFDKEAKVLAESLEELETEKAALLTLESEVTKVAIEGYRINTNAEYANAEDLNADLRSSYIGAKISEGGESVSGYRQQQAQVQLLESDYLILKENNEELAGEVLALERELASKQGLVGQINERRLHSRGRDLRVKKTDTVAAVPVPVKKSGGALAVCPLRGDHNFVDTWGASRSGGRRHKGVDMFAEIGVPVVAPASGLVQNATNSLGGISFRLFADNGYYFYGTHLDSLDGVLKGSVKNGKKYRVEAGDLLGYNGKTGNARNTPPHLHFEVHKPRYTVLSPFAPTAEVCSGARF